jgi:hypothetical protein
MLQAKGRAAGVSAPGKDNAHSKPSGKEKRTQISARNQLPARVTKVTLRTVMGEVKPYVPAFDWFRADRVGWFEGRAEGVHVIRADHRFSPD